MGGANDTAAGEIRPSQPAGLFQHPQELLAQIILTLSPGSLFNKKYKFCVDRHACPSEIYTEAIFGGLGTAAESDGRATTHCLPFN